MQGRNRDIGKTVLKDTMVIYGVTYYTDYEIPEDDTVN